MEWVKINEEGEIEFVADEVKLVPEVQAILALNYNKQKKDTDGRKRYRAKNELRYLYLVYSMRSPYKDYSEEERIKEAKLECGFGPEWVESPELKALIPKFIKGTQNKAVNMLKKVHKFIDKFETHLDKIDLNERNSSGGLVHTPKSVIETLNSLPKLLETLQELENQARLGIVAKSNSRGDHELGWLAVNSTPTKKVKEEDDSTQSN